jgi:hypothetical protein
MELNEYQVGQQEFNLPHDLVQLPSGGIFYKSKKKAVKVGYLTAADENLILNANLRKSLRESLILPLLRTKIYEKEIRPEELLEGDIEAILIFLRNTAFGPEYVLNLVDPKSDKSFAANILLDEVNIKKTDTKPSEDGTFTVTLPKSRATVKLKLLSLVEQLEVDKMIDSYPDGRIAPIVTWRLAKNVVELNGDSDKGKIATFVENMPIADSKFIRTFLKDNEPRLDLKKEVIAPSGEKVVADITFGVEFFRPFF